MKITRNLLTGACAAALAFAGIATASAASPTPTATASPTAKASPKAKASPTASPAASASATTAKAPRAVPFRGTATGVDQSAKTFTIGKLIKRTLKVTGDSKITKGGSDASFSDLTDDTAVTGSYFKKDDGTLEVKSLKITGGGNTGEKPTTTTKKKSKKDAGTEATASGDASPSPSPAKK
jgi:hypothetical protein